MDKENYYDLIEKLESNNWQDRESALNSLRSYFYRIIKSVSIQVK